MGACITLRTLRSAISSTDDVELKNSYQMPSKVLSDELHNNRVKGDRKARR